MEYKNAFNYFEVKVVNKKTGEVTILPPELVEKALEEAREKWIDDLIYGYYRRTD